MTRARSVSAASKRGQKHEEISDEWLEEFIPYTFYRITSKLNLLLSDNLRAVKVSKGRWRVMSVLYPRKKLSINEIADATIMNQATVSRVINQMERDKLVIRENPAHDTRIFLISLSKTGQSHFKSLHAKASKHEGIALEGLKATELRQLKSYLQRITDNIEAQLK